MYKCRSCGAVMDRDENGTRGIFLCALLDGALILSGDHAGNSSYRLIATSRVQNNTSPDYLNAFLFSL